MKKKKSSYRDYLRKRAQESAAIKKLDTKPIVEEVRKKRKEGHPDVQDIPF